MLKTAADLIEKSKCAAAFTGAGISVESGIPPFRGENGIWNKYEEKLFDIDYFNSHKEEAWDMLCDGFYESALKARPNAAHLLLAALEKKGKLKSIITQNIDNLHTKAGNANVREVHGNIAKLLCQRDGIRYDVEDFDLKSPPLCKKCGAILKPDFVFFGEQLPEYDLNKSIEDASKCDLMIIIGSTGIVYPAASIPNLAKEKGAKIIEVNPQESVYSKSIADVYIKTGASDFAEKIAPLLKISI